MIKQMLDLAILTTHLIQINRFLRLLKRLLTERPAHLILILQEPLDFDAATIESAVFSSIIPEAADLTNGMSVRVTWMATTATTGNVRWRVALERGNTDLDADSFDTATEANGAANGTSGIATTTSITLTTIDSVAIGEPYRLRMSRVGSDATHDTMTGDAEVISVEVRSAA